MRTEARRGRRATIGSVEHAARKVGVRYEVPLADDAWTLPEETVPESQPHDLVLDLLKQILLAWASRVGDTQVARNLAVRWDESRPQMGVDPDLCVIRPRTPEGDELMSLCTWESGHSPPVLAVEVVSASNARKDYATAPERYAACGVDELWVFDPRLCGPRIGGGPHRLQIWRRTDEGDLARTYAGAGPARSVALGAWLLPVDEGRKLRVAGDERGETMWLTAEETERAEKERERAEKERERAEKERAEREVARLEAEIAALRLTVASSKKRAPKRR